MKQSFLILLSLFWSINMMADVKSAEDVRLMSFNLRYGLADDGKHSWRFRVPAVRKVIEQTQPDILGVQEALQFQLNETLQYFPDYAFVGEARDGGTEGEYSAIIYNSKKFELEASETFWFSDTPSEPSAHWGNRYRRICTWGRFRSLTGGQVLYVFNMHWDHESQYSRERSARLLNEVIVKTVEEETEFFVPVFVMGDFNAGKRNSAIEQIRNSSMLVDTYYEIKRSRSSTVGTFHQFNGDDSGDKIDFIFSRGALEVISAEIMKEKYDGLYPSDHFPVTATVRIHNK